VGLPVSPRQEYAWGRFLPSWMLARLAIGNWDEHNDLEQQKIIS
jgi:hypothetical protein